MTTEKKNLMDLSEFSKQVFKASRELHTIVFNASQGERETLVMEVYLVNLKLQYICSRMGLDTSDSGTKTEASPSPTGKPGGSQAPSILGEQIGETE